MANAKVDFDPDKTVRLIRLHGDLCMFDQKRIEELLPSVDGGLRLLIDCSQVTSMDSTIIALLMRYRQRLQINGGNPANIVIIASERLMRLFEITGVCRAMTVLPDT